MVIWAFIMEYWMYVPTAMVVARVIANATPNETDDKIVAVIQNVIDAIALSPKETKVKLKPKE